MIEDVYTVMWKEWRELLQAGAGGRFGMRRILFAVGILGVLGPLQAGRAFVTGWLAVAFAGFAGAIYVAGVVPDSFAGERERHTLETLLASRLPDRAILLGKLAAVLGYGLVLSAGVLLVGVVVTNVRYAGTGFLFYSPRVLLATLMFSLLAGGVVSGAGVLISLRSSTVRQAQQVLSTSVMLLIFVPVFGGQALPEAWKVRLVDFLRSVGPTLGIAVVVGALLLLDLVLVGAALLAFRRSRLSLD